MLPAVDDGFGTIMNELKKNNILDDTVILFTSDNGYFYEEHGLSVERRFAYEEGIRVPLLARYPKVVVARSRPNQLALSIDIAPTILDLAKARIKFDIQQVIEEHSVW